MLPRMWMQPPAAMCNKHILGEHLSLHQLANRVERGDPMDQFVKYGLVETHNILSRHDELVIEMVVRGINHKSPLMNPPNTTEGEIDVDEVLEELLKRCENCREKLTNHKGCGII